MEVHQQSISGKGAWDKLPNENRPGDEPYALSFPETARDQIERRRLPHKEIGNTLFDSTCRRSLPFEDKIKMNSHHIMESIEKGYIMVTNKNPVNLIASQASTKTKDPHEMMNTVSFSAHDSLQMKLGHLSEQEESLVFNATVHHDRGQASPDDTIESNQMRPNSQTLGSREPSI